jgi:signal transduction histidine kinase/ligand-binding sensor domain-containing protein
MKYCTAFIYLFFLTTSALAQVKNVGLPFLRNYSPEQYQAAPRNTDIAQDARNLLYFVNQQSILEFDGVSWQSLKIKGDITPTAIAQDAQGRLYIGGNGEIGFFQPDIGGALTYSSLNDKIPAKYRTFKTLQRILITQEAVFFLTNSLLFVWQGGQMRVLSATGFFDGGFVVRDKLFVREWGKGLLQWRNQQLEKVVEGEEFAYDRVFAMLPYKKDKILMVSRNKGCTLWDTQATHNPFWDTLVNPQTQGFLKTNLVTCGTKVNDTQFAIGTSQNGLLVIDEQGKIITHLNQSKGLRNHAVNAVFLDSFRNIWLATEDGIIHIELNSPFSSFNQFTGLEGAVTNLIMHRQKLYVGTSQGIYWQHWRDSSTTVLHTEPFKLVKNAQGFSGLPFSFQQELLYSHHNGVLVVKDSLATPLIPNEAALSFVTLRAHPGCVLMGKVHGGLALIEKKNGTWIFRGEFKNMNITCNNLTEDNEGNIWACDYNKGIFKLRFSADLRKIIQITPYGERHGLPQYSRNSIFWIQGQLLANTRTGFFRYDTQKDAFEAYNAINRHLFAPGYAYPIMEDPKGNLWFLQFGKVGVITARNEYPFSIDQTAFARLQIDVLSHLLPIDAENIFFGTTKGLFHFNPTIPKNYHQPFHTLIRRVALLGAADKDSVIFAGAFGYEVSAATTPYQPKKQIRQFPYHLNSIRFGYAAVWFEDNHQTQYQYILEGYDNTWSEWTRKTEKSYTNLPEGNYIFKVRARSLYGYQGVAATYRFVVLAPWYRTGWAYLSYVVLAVLLIVSLLRWNTWRLRRKNAYLAREIAKATAQIQAKNVELEQKNAEIEQSYQDMKLLGEMGKDVTAQLSIVKIVDTVYENINKVMDASIFGIGIFNAKDNTLDFYGAKENGDTIPDFQFSLNAEERLASWCFHHQQEILINDYLSEYPQYISKYQPAVTGRDASSVIYVPLLTNKQIIGVITVQSFQKHSYTPYHLNILQNLALHTAIALENARAYLRLAELNEEKNQLIGIVAHDLRNPLHHIHGLATVIGLHDQTLTPKQKDYTQKILEATTRINEMIAKILDMNAIESNKINLKWEKVDIAALLKQIREDFGDESKRKNIAIELRIELQEAWVEADKNYTFQVFENLVSNALKFTPQNESIRIDLQRLNGKIRTAIHDSGPGISAVDLPRLFGKFQKLTAKPTGGENSTGLGLSIVKRYVELMQGTVWCESNGHGAVFFVEFAAQAF